MTDTADSTKVHSLAPVMAALGRRSTSKRAIDALTDYRRQCLEDPANIGEPSIRLAVEVALYAKGDAHIYISVKDFIAAFERHRSGI